jgi:hypothetical protein
MLTLGEGTKFKVKKEKKNEIKRNICCNSAPKFIITTAKLSWKKYQV